MICGLGKGLLHLHQPVVERRRVDALVSPDVVEYRLAHFAHRLVLRLHLDKIGRHRLELLQLVVEMVDWPDRPEISSEWNLLSICDWDPDHLSAHQSISSFSISVQDIIIKSRYHSRRSK